MAKKTEKTIIDSVYLNPRTDFGFKKMFFNKGLLINFLNDIIREEGRIIDIEYLPFEQLGDWDTNRKAVFDIYCKNEKGEYFIVEMQKAIQAHFLDRSLFYAASSIWNQAPKGKWNYELKTVYFVAIMNFIQFKEKESKPYYIERAYLFRDRAKEKFSEKMNMIFIELPKFTKSVEELTTNEDKWLFIFKNLDQLKSYLPEIKGEIFEEIFKIMQIKKLTSKEMEEYKVSVTEYEDIQEAMEIVRKEGIEEGRFEERLEVAINCLQDGLSVETVSKLTKLSVDQVKGILKKLKR
ncbi:MAG: Rpn family recombination-promoting nuclease/putative transposase [Prevotellaceae bacterium]|jgi:predicted transposase/invertase (TIGR01784 family)|nr:Rpn family recombination-promoting nuclease/putative transposase [Prevotellaceae bacterium]